MKVSELISKLQGMPQDAVVAVESGGEYRTLGDEDFTVNNDEPHEPGTIIRDSDCTEDEYEEYSADGQTMGNGDIVLGAAVIITTWS